MEGSGPCNTSLNLFNVQMLESKPELKIKAI
jgi:hypothetical protein